MRVGLICLAASVGFVAAVGAAPNNAEHDLPPGTDTQKALDEAPVPSPIVSLDKLKDQTPDGGYVIELYKTVRNVRDVEAVNERVNTLVITAQSIATDIARLHATTFKSCESSEVAKIEAIANKTRAFATTLARVDAELTKSVAAMRQQVEAERPGSIRAKEEVNRLVLAAHELGRLRMQVQVAKNVGSIGVSMRTAHALCAPTPVPPLFAEHDGPPVVAPAIRSPSLSRKRLIKPTARLAPRLAW